MAQAKDEAAIEQEQAVVEVAAQAVAAAKQEAAARQEKAVAEAVAEAVAQVGPLDLVLDQAATGPPE